MRNTTKLRTLYIGGLPGSISAELVRTACQRFGAIDDARVLVRREGVIAYVTFADERAADEARRALNGSVYAGQRLRVDFAT